MRFDSWFFLIAIPLLLMGFRFWKRRNTPRAVPFSLRVPDSVKKTNPVQILLGIRLLALALLIVALARPQTNFKQMERTVSGIDIVMVMDVSASMLVEDLGNRSRLEIAKQTMREFIEGRQNDRIGFVIFSGEPLTLAPPTLDYSILVKSVDAIDTGILKDGTAIGDGLSLAVSRLKNSTAKSRVIILLTDGDNNVGQVDPATAGDLAGGYGIKVYTIAIGKEGRVKLPIRQKGMFGNVVTSYQWFDNALNADLLKQIAQSTKGKFYRVTDEDTLKQVFNEIDQYEKSEVKTSMKIRYDEHFEVPMKWALLLLLLEQILATFWWRLAL